MAVSLKLRRTDMSAYIDKFSIPICFKFFRFLKKLISLTLSPPSNPIPDKDTKFFMKLKSSFLLHVMIRLDMFVSFEIGEWSVMLLLER